MDEMHKLMQEHEQFLEEALEAMECGWPTQDQIVCIRQACGKPSNKRNTLLQTVFNDFDNIFGGKNVAI